MPTRTLTIRGSVSATGDSRRIATQRLAAKPLGRIVPGRARDGATGTLEVPADAVARVELENGFVLWTRADDLARDHGERNPSRDGAEAWEFGAIAPLREGAARSERGLAGLAIRTLEFFGVDLAGFAASKLCTLFENKQLQGRNPGLHRLPLEGGFALTALGDGEAIPADRGPLLVFIHGTASSGEGSFGKLWAPDNEEGAKARAKLAATYAERVFAFEHRSLTESPIANALALVERLPAGAKLHLVSHSRGGMVGELLCLGGCRNLESVLAGERLKALFAADRTLAEQLGLKPLDAAKAKERDAAYEKDREALARLRDALGERRIEVERFVRAACPARGTTLASGRLDRWLSALDFLFEQVAGARFAGEALDFLLAVVKERTDPRTLPGLEAMMPGSALTRLLNHPELVTTADLSVIAGDIEGDSLWERVKVGLADWFYGADHDLVVNTGSMSGGLRRPDKGARFQLDQGPEVNHFSYFRNPRSVRWLVEGLGRTEGSDAGFQPIQAAPREEPRWREAQRRSRSAALPRPLAVLLPGAMGTSLDVNGENVWVDYWALFRGGLARLRMGAAGVEPVAPLEEFYGPLIEFLARSHRVEIFPYDWRLSVREAAVRLADRLEDWLPEAERGGQPVHLVAHSMGGLVARAMIASGGRGGALWRRILALPNSRLLMLGTPNLGSHEALRWLTGYNPTQAKLSLLDIVHRIDAIVDIVRTFPGLAELLPFDPEGKDFGRQGLWTELREALGARWQVVEQAVLSAARDTWALLKNAAPDPQRMIYVAGCQPATVVDYQVTEYPEVYPPRRYLDFTAVRQGDGTVTWKSGFLPGVPVWYVPDTAHDELCARESALPGYLDLLMTGATTHLPSAPPARWRAAAGLAERFPMPALPFADGVPDERDARALGFGPGRPLDAVKRGPAVPMIRVSVCQGDLAYAKHPVLAGHYLDDAALFNAEAALDDRLGGALSRRLQLGLYPGLARTHAVFFNNDPKAKPQGAVVLGLGRVGELSAALLQTGVRDALLDYALQVAQWPDDRFGPSKSVRSAALSCVLVGSGAGGVTVRDSMEAVLRGAVAANERLVKAALNGRVLIDRIEFLDQYQDVALAAAEALERALMDGQLAQSVAWPDRVVEEGQGRKRRVRFEDSPGWWHRLEIVEERRGGGLRYIFSTDRARAEVTQSSGQLELAERFIAQASQSPARNAEAAKTLFEMLLPNRLKELAPRQTDLVLVVDEASARYPWELLEDRWSETGRPPAVQDGLLRQLKAREFRPRPAHASADTAFVVGNPDLEHASGFADLPGARDEAQKVAALLKSGGYRVRDCIDEKTDAILNGLHRDAWRVLHLAGHGVHEFPLGPAGKSVSGMLIGKDVFLTPGDVEQMRWVPELVFINCCHLGRTGGGHGSYGALAANLAVRFIRMGVKAIVAAGWAVDDAAASAFAERFYARLLAGERFGDAVRAAREEIWTRFPGVNTWGAYQCYGDPGYRLRQTGAAAPSRNPRKFHAPAELIAELDNLAEGMRVKAMQKGGDPAAIERMHAEISALFGNIPEDRREQWLARGDVAAAIGFARGEGGDLAEAVQWLDRALRATSGDCPVRTAEQCANFRVRLAGERWRKLRASAGEAGLRAAGAELAREIEAAIRELDLIAQRAPTPERYSLLGGACKRLAPMRAEESQRLEALVNMANYYRRAFESAERPEDGTYPFSNWAVASVLACLLDPARDGAWRAAAEVECGRMIEAAPAAMESEPSFWNAVGEPDCRLARLLLGTNVTPQEAEQTAARVASLYRAAAARGASPRDYASVLDHLDFITTLGAGLPQPVKDAVASIRAGL